jgi:hypothetical protein
MRHLSDNFLNELHCVHLFVVGNEIKMMGFEFLFNPSKAKFDGIQLWGVRYVEHDLYV